MKTLTLSLFLVCVFLLHGCGYHFGQGDIPNRFQTITVPYAKGDTSGELTNALIEQVSKSGALRYKRYDAELALEVSILDLSEENVGFRYDHNKKGKREKSTIPTETRITAVTEVTVIETRSGAIVFGPKTIESSFDFDHNYYFGSDSLNRISLGQVTDIDDARDAVQAPLFDELAEKIVSYIIHSW